MVVVGWTGPLNSTGGLIPVLVHCSLELLSAGAVWKAYSWEGVPACDCTLSAGLITPVLMIQKNKEKTYCRTVDGDGERDSQEERVRSGRQGVLTRCSAAVSGKRLVDPAVCTALWCSHRHGLDHSGVSRAPP